MASLSMTFILISERRSWHGNFFFFFKAWQSFYFCPFKHDIHPDFRKAFMTWYFPPTHIHILCILFSPVYSIYPLFYISYIYITRTLLPLDQVSFAYIMCLFWHLCGLQVCRWTLGAWWAGAKGRQRPVGTRRLWLGYFWKGILFYIWKK